MQSKRKIYYIPGWISILILPFIVLVQNNKEIKSRNIAVKKIRYFEDSIFDKYYFGKWERESPNFSTSKIKWDTFYLSGTFFEDTKTITNIQLKYQKIINENNFKNGIVIKLLGSCTYNSFIKIMDLMEIEGGRAYLLNRQTVYLFELPNVEEKNVYNGPVFICGNGNDYKKKKPLNPNMEWLRLMWKNGKVFIIPFVIFSLVVFFRKPRK